MKYYRCAARFKNITCDKCQFSKWFTEMQSRKAYCPLVKGRAVQFATEVK